MSTSTGTSGAGGRVVGGFTLLEPLGKGATGTVYKGRPAEPGPPVAVKLFHERDAGDEQEASARREFASASQLLHRNIIRTLSVGQEGSTTFMVMELLEGTSLRDRLRGAPGPMDPLLALELTTQLALGLHHAHEQGVVHRDIKPANIWLTADGEVKVLDFGVAKARDATITADGSLVGTIAYMSPEQVAGRGEPDARSDVFAAGAVLYEMLTGRRPFDAESVPAQLTRILQEPPPPLPAAVAAVPGVTALVERALAKKPEQRFGDALEFALAAWDVLLRAQQAPRQEPAAAAAPRVAGEPGTIIMRPEAAAASASDVAPAPTGGSGGRLAVAAVLVTAVLGAGGYFLLGRPAAPPAASAGDATARDASSAAPAPTTPADGAAAAAAATDGPRDVVVSSDPTEASVLVDGKAAASKTPATLSLRVGQVVRVTKPGHTPADVTVTDAMLTAGTLQATLSTAAPNRLRASGDYPFEVVVGSRVVSPAATAHTVTVMAGLPARLRNTEYLLDLPVRFDGRTGETDVRIPPPGRLSLRTTYETCAVFLDGRDFGYPPLAGLAVASGRHAAELRCPDGRTLRSSFTIEPGQPHVEVIR